MAISLTVVGQKELREVSEKLKRGQGTLRRELTKAFKDAGDATLRRVKQNVETMSVKGYRTRSKRRFSAKLSGTRIRHRIARVTELDVSTSSGDPRVKFVVRADRLGNAKNLPFHFDSGKTFRHPIMGNKRAWAGQSGEPWFYDEIKKDLDVFRRDCQDAIDRTIQQIGE